MPSLVILVTNDGALADRWEKQVPNGLVVQRITSSEFLLGNASGFAAVVVLDAAYSARFPASLERFPTIFVGEPRSLPFEQARLSGRAKVYLTYEESSVRLRELIPLLDELSEKQSMVEMLSLRKQRFDPRKTDGVESVQDQIEIWDFLEGAIESLESKDRMINEFRRAARGILHASHVVFFFRDVDGFRADRGSSFFTLEDPLVSFLESHPAIIDGIDWDGPVDPAAELAVRNRIALWGARLLVPIHDNGRLLGLIALGVRDDGQNYNQKDRARALFFARLLRHFITKYAQFSRLVSLEEKIHAGAKYLPSTLVLAENEATPRYVPLIVRELISVVRRTREITRKMPTEHQPFRAAAGIIAETGGVWAQWQEASTEVFEAATRERVSRRALLSELGITLSHELGNALVSLATFRQFSSVNPFPLPLVETIKKDIKKLEVVNSRLGLMQTLFEATGAILDVRELAQNIGASMGVRVEVGPDAVNLEAARVLLEFALRELIETVSENRAVQGAANIALQVRSTGAGPELTALISIKGKNLELEGVAPEPSKETVPNLGRLGVFLAKEILRLHNGEIHAGPGMEGTEILISFRKL